MPQTHVATAASAVQAKPKASAQRHKPSPQALARNHPPPVSPPRHRRRSLRRPALLPQPGRRPHSRLPRGKQPVQRRARARQRRILRARAQKRTLPTTQLGIFRKDNFFEVVLDPSPDKPEKRILGPAPSCQQIRRSTGVHLTQPRRQPATKLIHSIGASRHRQFPRTARAELPAWSLPV